MSAPHSDVTSETLPEIMRLKGEGLTFEEVAERLQLRRCTVVNRYYAALKRGRDGDKVSARLKARRVAEIDLYRQGYTLIEIGKQLGVSDETVMRDLKLAREAGIELFRRREDIKAGHGQRVKPARETADQAAQWLAALAGLAYDYGPFIERPFVRIDRPGLHLSRGTTASQCAESGATGSWAWRATSQTYGKAGAA